MTGHIISHLIEDLSMVYSLTFLTHGMRHLVITWKILSLVVMRIRESGDVHPGLNFHVPVPLMDWTAHLINVAHRVSYLASTSRARPTRPVADCERRMSAGTEDAMRFAGASLEELAPRFLDTVCSFSMASRTL